METERETQEESEIDWFRQEQLDKKWVKERREKK